MIVALTGFARSGKDTVGKLLTDHHGFRRVAFGDVLKGIAEDVNPSIRLKLGEDPMAPGSYAYTSVSTLLDTFDGWEEVKDECPEARQLLVDLGNSLRKRIPGIEVNSILANTAGEDVVNTNVYHPEELDRLRELGALTVRVIRPGYGPANPDEANTGRHPVDAEILNDGSLDELAIKVDRLVGYYRGQ